MRDYSQEELESSRPNEDALHCVEFCLEQLFKDRTKRTEQVVAGVCTYEELIGALLAAKDELERNERVAGTW